MVVRTFGGGRYWLQRAIRIAATLAVAWVAAGIAGATPGTAAEKHAILIIDANTGQTLYQSSADALRHPASLTKMMTLYLVFEQIEQGKLSYQTKIRMSANAVAAQPSKLDLDEGEEIAVIDAIKALITKSANDIAIALAEHIGGSEQRFARLMTQKAAQIGMKSTLFKNASGLPDDEQVTTARDMVTLGLRLQDDFPRHYPLFGTKSFTYKGDLYKNHNKLLVNYEGTDGLKTGYTRASGFNLVSSVRRGKKHVVGAVFGGATGAVRDRTMRTFLNIGLVKASTTKTRNAAPALVADAKPKPVPQPKLASVPAPKKVERPALRPSLPASDANAGVPQGSAESKDQPASQPIEMARVRAVAIGPKPAAGSAPDSIEAVLQRTEQQPQQRYIGASAGGFGLRGPDPATLERQAQIVAAKPSTLEGQAERIASGNAPTEWQPITTQSLSNGQKVPQPAPAQKPTQVASAAGAAGGFQVQIGAYQSAAEAERSLAAVRDKAPGVLRNRAAVTMQLKQGDKTLHRARFGGFAAAAEATNACTELKRLKVDCLVLKAE